MHLEIIVDDRKYFLTFDSQVCLQMLLALVMLQGETQDSARESRNETNYASEKEGFCFLRLRFSSSPVEF